MSRALRGLAALGLALLNAMGNPGAAQDVIEALGGAEFELSGNAAFELRIHPESPQFEGQRDNRLAPSVTFAPEFRLFWDTARFTFIPFLRYDPEDTVGRTHSDIRELNLYTESDDWDLTVGLGKVFWGVAESRHLVDIINQTDGVEDIDEEDKLGQPMVQLNLLRDWGEVGLFLLPGFRERTFVGQKGRLRLPLRVDTDNPIYESAAEDRRIDAAARYAHTVGDWDFGASYFHGTGRAPTLIPDVDANGSRVLRPRYEVIDQFGLDVQATLDAWLLKFEGIHRSGQGDSFFATVGGFEYTFFGVSEEGADLGVLAEYHYDGRGDDAPPTIFDNDIFLGARYVWNDEFDTEFLGGGIIDQSNQSVLLSVEASRRLNDQWSLDLESRFFLNANDDPLLESFSDDGFVLLRLSRFF